MLGGKPGCGLKVRVWVERDGRKVLGPGRVELLGLIDRHRSIAAAAKRMGMSYRRAWGLVRDMNEAAGEPLVAVTTGGPGGGGATLTPRGQEAVALYRRIADRLARAAGEFAGPPPRQ
jgi:molybdate transport system regulatory protein